MTIDTDYLSEFLVGLFWVENTGPDDLVFLCCGTPPGPGPDEAIVWTET